MPCKKCGKEIPSSGKFCPFCGTTISYDPDSSETAAFIPETNFDNSPMDTDTWESIRENDIDLTHKIDAEFTSDFSPFQSEPAEPTGKSAAQQRQTTYYNSDSTSEKPYKKPPKEKKTAATIISVLLILTLIGGAVWFFLSRRPSEDLVAAQKYMEKGNFSAALDAYESALATAKNAAEIQVQIDLLKEYLSAEAHLDNGDYDKSLALLNSLKDRIIDSNSTLYQSVEDMIARASSEQSHSKFEQNLQTAQDYLSDDKLDSARAQLDMMASDTTLTSEQQKQITKLYDELDKLQQTADRKKQTESDKKAKKQAFIDQMNQLEENDKKINEADTTEKALEATATSFEAWDTLLSNIYDYLASTLNAEAYSKEEESYKKWVEERDSGADNAAKDSADAVSSDLAKASFKQSYTKARCYKMLDLIS